MPCDACQAGIHCFGPRCPCCCREPDRNTANPIASARALLAEHHQPVAMTHTEVWRLLARYQRRLVELVDAAAVKPAVDIPRRLDEIAVAGRWALDDEHADRQTVLENLILEVEQLATELGSDR